MYLSMRKNAALTSLAIGFLAIVSYCQLQIPALIADGLSNIMNGNYNSAHIFTFGIVFFCKNVALGLGSSLASYIESDTRFFLINSILSNPTLNNVATGLTLVKEDAERVASAVSELIQLTGSCILTILTAYILIAENFYFCVPIIVITIFTTRYVRTATKTVQEAYKTEIKKEELYKASILQLFNLNTSRHQSKHSSLTKIHRHLEEATYARYLYNKTTLVLSFWPELAIAISAVFIIMLSARFSTELFGVKLIAYLGYIGIFSMASANSVRMALSLIGINVSVKRIFEGRI